MLATDGMRVPSSQMKRVGEGEDDDEEDEEEEEEEEEDERGESKRDISSSRCLTGQIRASERRMMVRKDVCEPLSVFRCVGMDH
jgi:TATA-binding protein-associated factor Taf7